MREKNKPWYQRSFRRSLTDMHIPDGDERFLSQLNPQYYVEMLELANVDTAMIYADSCLGICYWPTKAGHVHNGIKGRDVLGEIIDGCHQKGINVIVYYNYWSKWAYDEHPEWRFISGKGEGTAEYLWTKGRYGVCCFNTPYRDFMHAQIEDLSSRYEFEGMWIDMIFWPYSPCYCWGCRKRYREETGADLPRAQNWTDPDWVRFQRKREEWLAEFIGELTAIVKRHKPQASIGHQCSAWASGWQTGLTNSAFRHSDYVSGDFYGDALQQSFTCKAFYHLSENKPFEFMTSRCPDLSDHTTTKSKELLRAQMFSALANQGAFLFIDAIDPVGTMDRRVYAMMGELYQEAEVYEQYIDHDAHFCQDAAIYINFESEIKAFQDESTLIGRAMNTAKTLMDANIPYGVITKKNLAELARFQIVLLPNVVMMDEEEAAAFKQYVNSGGSLYASKRTSMMNKAGVKLDSFQLTDLFGVTYQGETDEQITYIAPVSDEDKEHGLAPFTRSYPATLRSSQMIVHPAEKTEIMATITMPYFNPRHIDQYSSAISNPPGRPTSWPAMTRNRYGAGQVVYCSGELENVQFDDHRSVFVNVLRSLRSRPFYFESDAPKCVEIMLFHDESKRRFRVHLVNMQKELPNIPVEGITIKVRMEHKVPLKVVMAPDEAHIDYMLNEGYVIFTAPKLETFAMFIIEYLERV